MEFTIGANRYVPDIGANMTDAAAGKARKAGAGENPAAGKVAREFEAMFVGMMLKSMRETVGKDKLTGGGHGEEVYRSMLDQEYAKALTEHGGIGLTAMLERQLDKPVLTGDRSQGNENHDRIHDTTTESTKTEVTYENR